MAFSLDPQASPETQAALQLLTEYPVVVEVPVQWGDQDALGHVNNVVFFRWWETSRVAFIERIGLVRDNSSARLGTVLVSIHCDFRKQLVYPDRVLIGARPGCVGNSSLKIEHRLVSVTHALLSAEAESTIVTFDFDRQQTVPVPDEIRERIARLAGTEAAGH